MDAIDLGLLYIHRLLKIHTERTSAISPDLKEFLDQQMFAPLVRKRNYISIIIEGMRDRDIYHLTDTGLLCYNYIIAAVHNRNPVDFRNKKALCGESHR